MSNIRMENVVCIADRDQVKDINDRSIAEVPEPKALTEAKAKQASKTKGGKL